MKLLAMNIGQCSGCALFHDNKIIFATSEERYSREKSDESYPLNSINAALKYCKIHADEIDRVLVGGYSIPPITVLLRMYSKFSVNDHLIAMEKYWLPKLSGKKYPNLLSLFSDKISYEKFPFDSSEFKTSNILNIEHHDFTDNKINEVSNFFKKAISSHLGIDESKIIHMEHHLCHAAYAFYGSPIRDDKTLIFTADAWGDHLSATISYFDKKNQKIVRLREYSDKNFQLARIYRYTTLYMKMLPDEHEYKVMGLAPYNDDQPKIAQVEKVFQSMQSLDGLEFRFNSSIKNIFSYLEENLRQFRFDQIASGLQSFTEKILTQWIQNVISEYGSKTIVFSGGISMNVKANMKISQLHDVEKLFICGGGSDQSLSMGSCYAYSESQKIIPKSLENLYLGDSCVYSDNDLKKISGKYNIFTFENTDQLLKRILDGKIIATCLGRTEMGPRALCNRSILADPTKRENIEIINRKIKNRDFWMPFAPVILHEFQDQLLENPKKIESPHMTIGFDTIKGKERIPAAVHQYDGTARPLILKKETNPLVWELINKFHDKTGIPALLNTSFNLHGKPIVNSFLDALHVFENSGLDVLWLDKHIIEKS